MKFLVVSIFLIVAVCNIRAEIKKEDAVAIVTGCKTETGASDADLELMRKHEPSTTKEGKCLRACTFKKFGVMSDKGKMIKPAAIELAKHIIKDEDKKAVTAEAVAACEKLNVSDDHCEAAEEYALCGKKSFAKKGVTVFEDLLS